MGARPHLSFFACKTEWLDPEWRLSIGPSFLLWICALKTATLASELLVSMGPRPHLSFCACKTACSGPELQISMGPSPHLCFLHEKQRLLDQNYKFLLVPDVTYVFFCIQNGDFSTIITSLYGSQTSPVVLCMQNNVINIRITSLYGSHTSPMVFRIQKSDFSTKSLWVPALICDFVHSQQRHYDQN